MKIAIYSYWKIQLHFKMKKNEYLIIIIYIFYTTSYNTNTYVKISGMQRWSLFEAAFLLHYFYYILNAHMHLHIYKKKKKLIST